MSPWDPGRLAAALAGQTGTRPVEAPYHTITRQNEEAGVGPFQRKELPLGLLGGVSGVAVLMLLLAWWINRAAQRRPPAEDRALQRLARTLGLGRHGLRLVQEVAGEVGQTPLALLVSPGLLARSIGTLDQAAWSKRPGWGRLAALAGCGG